MVPNRLLLSALLVSLAGCVTAAPPSASTQREAFARSMGYPTRKSADELEQNVQKQTGTFEKTAFAVDGQLQSPQPLTIEGVHGTCYTFVMRLRPGATWGAGAEAGLRFDFTTPTGSGSGGPGLIGPGAVASVGCADADGPITVTIRPFVGTEPIGTGPYHVEMFSHVLTPEEAAHLADDRRRQQAESQAFARREREKKQQRASTGCNACQARWQGCYGASRNRRSCDSDFDSCTFDKIGVEYMSTCRRPMP